MRKSGKVEDIESLIKRVDAIEKQCESLSLIEKMDTRIANLEVKTYFFEEAITDMNRKIDSMKLNFDVFVNEQNRGNCRMFGVFVFITCFLILLFKIFDI